MCLKERFGPYWIFYDDVIDYGGVKNGRVVEGTVF